MITEQHEMRQLAKHVTALIVRVEELERRVDAKATADTLNDLHLPRPRARIQFADQPDGAKETP